MTSKLFISAITKFLLGVALVGLLIFLPAGSLSFFNGWLLMGILFEMKKNFSKNNLMVTASIRKKLSTD